MCLVSYFSWITSGSCPAHINPPSTIQDYITYYILSSFPFINIGESLTYQSCIMIPRLNHSCLSHPWLHRVHDWNIKSCHGWWRHLRLLPSWQTCKKIHIIRLQYSGDSGYKVKDDITTTKNLVTCTMLVDKRVHPGFWSYTGYQWNW